MVINFTPSRLSARWMEDRAIKSIRGADGNVLLGFYLTRRFDKLASLAIDREKKYVPMNFLKKRHNPTKDRVLELVDRIRGAIGNGSYKTVTWGVRDKLELNVGLDEYFKNIIRVEAGLLHSSSSRRQVNSYIMNYRGIYFDGRTESDLESGLNMLSPDFAVKDDLAASVVSKIIADRVSKYNYATSMQVVLPKNALLVIGQVNGDQAIEETETIRNSNKSFIEYICKTVPVEKVSALYYKPHPKNRNNKEEVEEILEKHPTVRIVPSKENILPILDQRPVVATLTSGAGLEAALRDCEVHCFGISFYSNWGFTNDYINCIRRSNRLTAADVFAYTLIKQTRYVDVASKLPLSVERAFDLEAFVSPQDLP